MTWFPLSLAPFEFALAEHRAGRLELILALYSLSGDRRAGISKRIKGKRSVDVVTIRGPKGSEWMVAFELQSGKCVLWDFDKKLGPVGHGHPITLSQQEDLSDAAREEAAVAWEYLTELLIARHREAPECLPLRARQQGRNKSVILPPKIWLGKVDWLACMITDKRGRRWQGVEVCMSGDCELPVETLKKDREDELATWLKDLMLENPMKPTSREELLAICRQFPAPPSGALFDRAWKTAIEHIAKAQPESRWGKPGRPLGRA